MVTSSRPDAPPGILDALLDLCARANAGESGPGTLAQLVEVAESTGGADGALFAEYGPARGEPGAGDARVVFSTGSFDRLVGAPLNHDRLLGAACPGYECRGADAVVLDRPVGRLVLGYRGDPAPGALRTVSAFATFAAQLYRSGNGLPLHSAGQVLPGDVGDSARTDQDLFIAATGHELRTPVTVIRGYADTLVEHWSHLDEEARRAAATVIAQRARDLGRLLDRLLSAAEDGLDPAEPAAGAPFDLADAVRAAVEEFPADVRRVLRLELPDSMPKAYGDRSTVATVLTELVTNARKYSPEGADVDVDLAAGTSEIRLRVADRGIGIRPEHVERAFERFWQSGATSPNGSRGVGLGLYLVRRIVERQRGWVSLRPRPGGGSIAEVRLPRADVVWEA